MSLLKILRKDRCQRLVSQVLTASQFSSWPTLNEISVKVFDTANSVYVIVNPNFFTYILIA